MGMMATLASTDADAVEGMFCTGHYDLIEIVDGEGRHVAWDTEYKGSTCEQIGGGDGWNPPDDGGTGPIGGGGLATFPVPGQEGRRVSADGKRIYAPDLGCNSEDVVRRRAAQHALQQNPYMARMTVVTLYMGAQTQRFVRTGTHGSLQFEIASECG